MTKAALLPVIGDPYIITAWVNQYKKWEGQIDGLYYFLNNLKLYDDKIKMYDVDLLNSIGKGFSVDSAYQHGEGLKTLMGIVTEDAVMFVEDDIIIKDPEAVNKAFRKLEQGYRIVGSPRFSCSQGILDKSAVKYDLDYTGYGDKGPNFWPNFFFTSKSLLLQTDLNFCAKGWLRGERIEELDLTVENEESGDTFVWGSIQLRNLVPQSEVFEMPQGHSGLTDVEDRERGIGMFDPNTGWIHIGSLSSTQIQDYLWGNTEIPEVNLASPTEVAEWERRLAWFLVIYETTKKQLEEANIRSPYEKRIHKMIKERGLSMDNIARLFSIYKPYYD